MMLNNHGWSLNQMLIYCGILLFFLFVAVFFIIQLSNSLGDTFKEMATGTVTYADVEDNVRNAASSYINKYYEEEIGTGTVTVTTDNLKKHNMLEDSSLQPTEEKKSCKGYALIKKENSDLNISTYIKCSNYETSGYQSWRLGE